MKLLEPKTLAALITATAPDVEPDGPTTHGDRHDVASFDDWPTARGVAFDSRMVRPGDVFFALPGESGHGVEHAGEALARGAAYLVSDRPHPMALLVADAHEAIHTLGRAARSLLAGPVMGITGSAGKTTTKTLVTHALGARSTPGNLNTPPALVAALVEAALMDAASDDPDHNRGALVGPGSAASPLVLELGIDRIGEMDQLVDLVSPDIGVITTIGEAHLAALHDPATVAREKSRLLESASGLKVVGAAAAHYLTDELRAATVAAALAGQISPPTGMSAVETGALDADGTLRAAGASVRLPWPGIAMAENALLALALAVRLGVEAQTALDRMVSAPLEHSRLEWLRGGDVTIIDDSYNANPLSVALALEVLHAAPAPRVAFLGDMRELGDVSRQRHRELGATTTDLDMVVAIGPAAAAIRETNPAALLAKDAVDAARYIDQIPTGATVLVKGSRSLLLERLVDALLARLGSERARERTSGSGGAPTHAEVSSW